MRAHRALAVVAAVLAVSPTVVVLGVSSAAAPQCAGVKATLVGTSGDDVLEGTKGADVIAALGGDDVVRGRGGDDRVCGGGGQDHLFGNAGVDRLHGGADRLAEDEAGTHLLGDVLDGGPGDDVLVAVHDARPAGSRRTPDLFSFADEGPAVVVDLSTEPGTATGQGADTLYFGPAVGVVGSGAADTVTGSAGRDTLHGRGGGDVLLGKEGGDVLYAEAREGETGDDVLRGGAGDDVLGSYAGRDDLAGGADHDFLEAYADRPALLSGDGGNDYVAQWLVPHSGASSQGGAGWDVLAVHGDRLEGRDPRATYALDLRDGTTTTALDVPRHGRVGGFEEHRLVGDLGWRFHGGAGADRVWAVTGGPLRAFGHDGADWLHGGPRDDLLDGGDGRDTGVRGGGSDTCRSVEIGC